MTIKVSKPAKGLREAITEIIGRGASVINGMTKGAAQDELEVSRKNWIINGDMQVSQRGDYTSATAVTDTTYYLDRWRSDEKTVACTVQQTTVTLPNGVVTKAIKTAATATGTGRIGATQHIEDVDSLEGQTVTVSFWMRSNNPYANCNIYQDGFATSWVDHNGDGEWQKVTQTVTLNSSITTFSLLVRLQNGASNVSITSGDYIEFTNVKLEIGDTATPFESRSYAEELRDCQRYYQKFNGSGNNTPVGSGVIYNTTAAICYMPLLEEMRTIPTVTNTGGCEVVVAGTVLASSAVTVYEHSSSVGVEVNVTISGGTAGQAAVLRVDNGEYFVADAEL